MKKLLLSMAVMGLVAGLTAGAGAAQEAVPLSVIGRVGYFLPSEGGLDNNLSAGIRLAYPIARDASLGLTYDYIKCDVSNGPGSATLSTLELSWLQTVSTAKPVDLIVGRFYYGVGGTLFMAKVANSSKNKGGFHVLGGYQTVTGWGFEAKLTQGKWSGNNLGGVMLGVTYKFM